jgi:hypothetical protein
MASRAGWTTARAAEEVGMSPAVFRMEVRRARARGFELQLPKEQWPDQRTPHYNPTAVRRYFSNRPGRGTAYETTTDRRRHKAE